MDFQIFLLENKTEVLRCSYITMINLRNTGVHILWLSSNILTLQNCVACAKYIQSTCTKEMDNMVESLSIYFKKMH